MRLDSIQVGKAEPSPAGSLPTTAINKTSVPTAEINAAGLVDDTIVDKANHGGPDQAVYVYMRDDYNWWENELGRPLRGGMFGEPELSSRVTRSSTSRRSTLCRW